MTERHALPAPNPSWIRTRAVVAGAADERARIEAEITALSTDWLHEDVIHFRDDVLDIVRNEST